jgi:DNA replication protein DnaC
VAGRQLRVTIRSAFNIDFDAWATYLGDAPLATAMLDRLVDGAVVIKIKGPSYRASRSGSPLAPPTPA